MRNADEPVLICALINDPPKFESDETRESSGKVRDPDRLSGRGHGGRGNGWLFEQQVQYKRTRKLIGGARR